MTNISALFKLRFPDDAFELRCERLISRYSPERHREERITRNRRRGAANTVCGAEPKWYPTDYWSQKECYQATVDSAVRRLNLPRLTALHRSSTRGTPVPIPAQAVTR